VGRRCRQQNTQNEHQPKQLTGFVTHWVSVITSLPPTWLAGGMTLAVYQTHEQIDVAIKRWKNVLDVNWPRARYARP